MLTEAFPNRRKSQCHLAERNRDGESRARAVSSGLS
jgi:hypothetical protein